MEIIGEEVLPTYIRSVIPEFPWKGYDYTRELTEKTKKQLGKTKGQIKSMTILCETTKYTITIQENRNYSISLCVELRYNSSLLITRVHYSSILSASVCAIL